MGEGGGETDDSYLNQLAKTTHKRATWIECWRETTWEEKPFCGNSVGYVWEFCGNAEAKGNAYILVQGFSSSRSPRKFYYKKYNNNDMYS